jgi:hypothetical protein
MRRSIVAVVPSVKLDCPHPISSFRCDTPPPHPVLARVVEKRGAASSKFKRWQKAEAAIARYRVVESLHLVRIELEVGGGHVLFEKFAALGARDWHDVVAFVEQPGERDLPRRYE